MNSAAQQAPTVRESVKRTRGQELHRVNRLLEELVQKRTEKLLKERDAAVAANHAKSLFLAKMSHELRTPLSSIIGFSRLLRRECEPERQRFYLDTIERNGEHLHLLIDDVLDFARGETGRAVVEIVPCDPSALVRDVTDMLRVSAQERRLNLFVKIPPGGTVHVRTDPAKVRLVLINLIGNAIRYTDRGSVTVRTHWESRPGSRRMRLIFEVEDTGIGIVREEQRRIFEPFVQGSNLGGRRGSGLGLTIAKQFATLMGGSIVLESTPGKGSIFRFEVPAQLASQDELSRFKEDDRRRSSRRSEAPEHRTVTADDDLQEQTSRSGNGASSPRLGDEQVAVLSPELRSEMERAILSLDSDSIAQAIDHVAEKHPALGAAFSHFARRRMYTAIYRALLPNGLTIRCPS